MSDDWQSLEETFTAMYPSFSEYKVVATVQINESAFLVIVPTFLLPFYEGKKKKKSIIRNKWGFMSQLWFVVFCQIS